MTIQQYREELIATANRIARPGFGILAADESTNTMGSRLKAIGVENTLENRTQYRNMLFNTKGWGSMASGVILFEETLNSIYEDDELRLQICENENVILGIKVDLGLRVICEYSDATSTKGLDTLAERSAQYYKKGARFAKWRAVLKIIDGNISDISIEETARGLAQYALICQQNGLVPIVEPEILRDGAHNIHTTAYWTKRVISACYYELNRLGVDLRGTLLKPSMVLAGVDYVCSSEKEDSSANDCSSQMAAKYTVETLLSSVPPSVPGIMFLSGGQSEVQATQMLHLMVRYGQTATAKKSLPWTLSFSYGRALQKSTLASWGGKAENLKKAQETFMERLKMNSLATLGKYDSASDPHRDGSEDLYERDYCY